MSFYDGISYQVADISIIIKPTSWQIYDDDNDNNNIDNGAIDIRTCSDWNELAWLN